MDELEEVLKIMEEHQTHSNRPTKSFSELTREFPHIPGLRQLASMETAALDAQQSATAETLKPEQA